MNIEFQRSPDQIHLLYTDKSSNEVNNFTEKSFDIINAVLDVIKRDYTEAFDALQKIYGNAKDHKFFMVRRFIKCNMSVGDHITDFDGSSFNFEDVICPMRGECTWDRIVCHPKFNTSLSDRELEVAKLHAEDLSDEQIADRLFISIFTVQNHRKNIFAKLNIKSRAQLVSYILKNFSD